MIERKYLPTFSDLIDRLSIVLLKSIFIPEHKEDYRKERADIESDIQLMLAPKPERAQGWMPVGAEEITAILVIMLANHTIWINESEIRKGGTGFENRLRFTHSINGVRSTAKNIIAKYHDDRVDKKVDCLAADLPSEFGQWDLFK